LRHFFEYGALLLKKSKGSPYSITEHRVPELIPVLGSQPADDVSHKSDGRLPLLSAWRSGAMVGRRTCDQQVASSIPGRARLRNDSGQVVHTQLPRR